MNEVTPEMLEALLPLAVLWSEEQEKLILEKGVRLNAEQAADAVWLGVAEPERVRLLMTPSIPAPQHPDLRAAGVAMHLITPFTAGLTLRHGIYIRSDFANDRFLVAHELVHTTQYERLGGFLPFLRQYLLECLTIGYPDAPLEQEAILKAEALREQL